MKNFFKSVLKSKLIKIFILIVIIVVVLTSSLYLIVIKAGQRNDDDERNAPHAVSRYTGNITLNSGQITSSTTVQDIWNEMKNHNNDALEYIDTPEQLLKLMNAELVTQYLDTRNNPDEPIDWNAQELNDVNSKNIQGIIKLKRSDTYGNNYTMTYVDSNTFQAYIDNYNSSGSENDKNAALSHFTLEAVTNTIGNSSGQAATITEGQTVNVPDGLGSVHTFMGWQQITSTTSAQYRLKELAGMNFDEEGFGKINGRYVIACTVTFGTVGDYVDFYQEDGTVIPCIIGDVKSQNDVGCTEWGHNNGQCIVEFVVDHDTWYTNGHGTHINPGTTQFHPEWNQNIIKAVNGGSYFENPNFRGNNITANGDVVGSDGNTNNENNEDTGITRETKYYAKVATWKEQTTTVTSDDPDVQESTEQTYTMSTTNVNYQDLVKGYTMPFEYLWALLVTTDDVELVLELANLVYNSSIEVTIFDNLSTETNTIIDTYTKKNRIDTSANVTIEYGNDFVSENPNANNNTNFGSGYQNSVNISDSWSEEEVNNYEIKKETVTRTNTLNAALTKADVWIEEYSQEYIHEQSTVTNSNSNSETLEDLNYPDEPNSIINDDTYGHAEELLRTKENFYKELYDYANGRVDGVESKIYNVTVNRQRQNTNQVETTNYVSSPANVVEKTDPSSSEDNFSTILLKDTHKNARSKIYEISSWLFEILESNDSTSDMVDLTKYLLYKTTGQNYGRTEFDFSEYTSRHSSTGEQNGSLTTNGLELINIAKSKLGCQYVYRCFGTKYF